MNCFLRGKVDVQYHQQVIHHWISECYVPGSGVSSIVEIQVKVAIQFDLRETNEDRTGKLQCGQVEISTI